MTTLWAKRKLISFILLFIIMQCISCSIPTLPVYESLGTWTVGPAGLVIDLRYPVPELSSFTCEIGTDIFTVNTEIQVLFRNWKGNNPLHFVMASPCIEIQPRNMELPGDILVTLPYHDADNNGIVDGTTIPETDLYPAYYDDELECWGPLAKDYLDTENNVLRFIVNHLEPFALWAAQKDNASVLRTEETAMHMIGYDWWTLEDVPVTETECAANLASHGITTVFVGAYGPDPATPGTGSFVFEDDGFDEPVGVTEYLGWFSLSTFITEVHNRGMKIVISVDCFNPNSPPDNAAHRTHLFQVFDFFVANYTIDGLMLDHIRFDEDTDIFTFEKITAVTSFVRELRESHADGLPIWLNLMRFYNGNFETRIGQRYADLASVCDYMCPMLYYMGDEWFPLLTDLIIQTNLTRTAANGVRVIPSLRTFGVYDPDTGELIEDITGTELGTQIGISCKCYTDGTAFFRYIFMDPAKWSAIDDYSL